MSETFPNLTELRNIILHLEKSGKTEIYVEDKSKVEGIFLLYGVAIASLVYRGLYKSIDFLEEKAGLIFGDYENRNQLITLDKLRGELVGGIKFNFWGHGVDYASHFSTSMTLAEFISLLVEYRHHNKSQDVANYCEKCNIESSHQAPSTVKQKASVIPTTEYVNLTEEWKKNKTIKKCNDISLMFSNDDELEITRHYSGESNVYECCWSCKKFSFTVYILSEGEASPHEIVEVLDPVVEKARVYSALSK